MEDLQVFKTRINVTFLLNKARREFYSEFMEENSVYQRKLFRAANEILGIKENLVPTFPDQLNKTLLANDIARFFVKKIVQLSEREFPGSNLGDFNVCFDFPLTRVAIALNPLKTEH